MMNNTNTTNTTAANTTLNNIARIITHSGVFHADEIACVALVELAKGAEVKVLRTRDQEIETTAADLVVDVFGGEFDHHTEEKFDSNGHKLSSIGLLWNGYKNQFMKSFGIDEVSTNPLESVIYKLDNMDNGEKSENVLAFNMVIGAFNSSNIGQNDGNFRQSVDFMKKYLQQVIASCKLETQRNTTWKNKVVTGKVVKLGAFIPDWENRSVQEGLDVQFACTFESWANQNSIQRTRNCTLDLKQLNEVEGVKFTHAAGFLAKVAVDATPHYLDELNKLI